MERDEGRSGASGLPKAVEDAVGEARARAAAEGARDTAARLDRDNRWSQEAAHVFRAGHWREAGEAPR